MALDPFPVRHHHVADEERWRVARGWFLVGGSAGTIRELVLHWTELVMLK
jgi:hypothetical protein